MRLTKSDRDAFVESVINDVPKRDFNAEAKKFVLDKAIALLPPKVREVWDNAETRGFINNSSWVETPGRLRIIDVPIRPQLTPADHEHLKDLSEAKRSQEDALDQLESRLRAVIASCPTLKAARERLPEFEKYLPADRDGMIDRSVPTISGLVDDLTKAGWPKDKTKPTKKTAMGAV